MILDNLSRLKHMRDAALTAQTFIQGETRESLDNDIKLVFAIIRALEIVGEAASKITKDFRDQNPQIPWQAVIGMRNRLVHAYFAVDLDQTCSTLTDDLPALLTELENSSQPTLKICEQQPPNWPARE